MESLCPGCLGVGPRSSAACEHCGVCRLLHSRYWIEAVLGARQSARTLRAVGSDDGRPVVIKELALVGVSAWKEVELFERGIKVLRGLGKVTPGISRYIEHFEETRGGELRYYLVQEWIAGRSLAERIEAGARFDEARARTIAGELLQTLAALHGLSPPIVHRDIKPGNIIERDDEGDGRARYILIDFDLVQDTMRPGGGSTMALGTLTCSPSTV